MSANTVYSCNVTFQSHIFQLGNVHIHFLYVLSFVTSSYIFLGPHFTIYSLSVHSLEINFLLSAQKEALYVLPNINIAEGFLQL